jgi:Holliday junction DNA helicase RuvA
MIGRLKGTVISSNLNSLLLDVHDVGYTVFVSQKLIANHPTGSTCTVFTHTHVREDLLELYGFSDTNDLRLFEQLINVSGIGCKTALGVFMLGNRSEIVNAIGKGDVAFFTGVPRLGKKNAQKLIVELKNKFDSTGEDLDLSGGDESDDVVVALQGFGFSVPEIRKALADVPADAKPEEKVRLALKALGR